MKKVLICVDKDIMLTALQFRLEKQGFDIIHAKTNKEVKESIEVNHFDLILADLTMEELSAIDISKWANKYQNNGDTPFLVLATLDDDGERLMEALNNGANDFIMKPFKPVELYFRINLLIPDLIA